MNSILEYVQYVSALGLILSVLVLTMIILWVRFVDFYARTATTELWAVIVAVNSFVVLLTTSMLRVAGG